MALLKTIKAGEELVFDLKQADVTAKQITVVLVENAGGRSFLKIFADRSIRIHHNRKRGDQPVARNGEINYSKGGDDGKRHSLRSIYE